MKNELKTLYKKDPVLAQKAAKALGYKIVKATSLDYDDLPDAIKKTLDSVKFYEKDIAFIRPLSPVGYWIKHDENRTLELSISDLKKLMKNSKFQNIMADKSGLGLTFK